MVNQHQPRSILRTSRSRLPPTPGATEDIYSHSEYHRRFSPKSVSFDAHIQRRDLHPACLPTKCPEILRAVGYREVAKDSSYPDPVSKWWLPIGRDGHPAAARGHAAKVEWELLNQQSYTREHFRIPDTEAERVRDTRWQSNPQRWEMLMGRIAAEPCKPIYYEESDEAIDGELELDWDWTGLKGYVAPHHDEVQAFLAEQKAKIDAIDRDIRTYYSSNEEPLGGKRKRSSDDRVSKRTKH